MVGLGLAKTLGRLTATRAPLLAIPRVLSPSLARVPRFPAAPSQLDTTRSAAHTPRFPTTVPAAARSPLDSQLRVAALSKLGVSCAASAGGLVSAGVRRRAGDAELECAGQRRGFARPHGKSQRGQKKSAAAPVVESFAGLPVGVETVVFRCDEKWMFRLYSGMSFIHLGTWAGMITATMTGMDGPSLWWCGIGTPLAGTLCYMVFLHATHHISRLAVTPGKIDRVALTVHTYFGGEKTHQVTRFDMQAPLHQKSTDLLKLQLTGRFRNVRLAGKGWQFHVDLGKGNVLHEEALFLLIGGAPDTKPAVKTE
mmetsp:Transcript_46743/g.111288  ORF Transcript_46743/g.111288 Transcript_46743/m.111288 type:complete len:311 (-) Transcript_46743:82-1014(-)